MSTTTTSSLSDTLPSAVPKLEAKGKNWAIFYVHFMDAVKVKGFWGNFNRTTPKPALSSEPTDEELKASISGKKTNNQLKCYSPRNCLTRL